MGQALLLIGGTIVASSDKTDAIFGESITINGGNIDAKGGEYGGAICASKKILITGGNLNLKAYNRWAASTLGGACSEVIIKGGTINTYSSQLSGISCKSDGSINILGGNVLAKGGQFRIAKCTDARYNLEQINATDGTNQLYLTPIKISDVTANEKIENLILNDNIKYDTKDMYTLGNGVDDTGMIYLYLPIGEKNIKLEINGKTYSGTVKTTEDENITTLE